MEIRPLVLSLYFLLIILVVVIFIAAAAGTAPAAARKKVAQTFIRAQFDYNPQDDDWLPCREGGLAFKVALCHAAEFIVLFSFF